MAVDGASIGHVRPEQAKSSCFFEQRRKRSGRGLICPRTRLKVQALRNWVRPWRFALFPTVRGMVGMGTARGRLKSAGPPGRSSPLLALSLVSCNVPVTLSLDLPSAWTIHQLRPVFLSTLSVCSLARSNFWLQHHDNTKPHHTTSYPARLALASFHTTPLLPTPARPLQTISTTLARSMPS